MIGSLSSLIEHSPPRHTCYNPCELALKRALYSAGIAMSLGEYRVAQICINGHAINDNADIMPQLNQRFCDKCGAETITACPHCKTGIRGEYDVPGVAAFGFEYTPPNFCHNCGEGYPWTALKISSAEQLADMIESLTPPEREQLKESIRNIVRDTPQTLVAAVKFQSLMARAGTDMKAAIWETISDMADAKAKKIIHL